MELYRELIMNNIKWNYDLSVNIVTIDDQHKTLVDLTNEVSQALEKDLDSQFTTKILSSLNSYVDYHFNTEEYYFELFGYPDRVGHIREHDSFREKIDKFQQSYSQCSNTDMKEIFSFLSNWIFSHIEKTDKKYSDFFIERGLG